jgi:large subunit ribosomal protein L24
MRATTARAPKSKIRKNDTVMVIAGRERGKTGKVLRVLGEKGRVVIERLNMVKRHRKPRGAQAPGGVVEKEASIHLSNVMMMCDRCNAPVRLGVRRLEDGSATRVCRRCGEVVDR